MDNSLNSVCVCVCVCVCERETVMTLIVSFAEEVEMYPGFIHNMT